LSGSKARSGQVFRAPAFPGQLRFWFQASVYVGSTGWVVCAEGRPLGNLVVNSNVRCATTVISGGHLYLGGDQGPKWILYDGLYSPVWKHGSRSRALLRVFEWQKLECVMKVSGFALSGCRANASAAAWSGSSYVLSTRRSKRARTRKMVSYT